MAADRRAFFAPLPTILLALLIDSTGSPAAAQFSQPIIIPLPDEPHLVPLSYEEAVVQPLPSTTDCSPYACPAPNPWEAAAEPFYGPAWPGGSIMAPLLPALGGAENGFGRERVMLAPFEIDVTQPFNRLRLRADAAYGITAPDRSEFFWAKIGSRGPTLPESGVDYQDLRFMFEAGNDTFSAQTELPLRFLDPDINLNTTGLGDMNLATKLVMFDGDCWQVTQITRMYIQTGSPKKGLGTGHFSMEPGLLARYKLSCDTYLHGELKLWFPIGGAKPHAGEVLRYGLGVSTIFTDTPCYAVIPTLELIGYSFLTGDRTLPSGSIVAVDSENELYLSPGVRVAFDTNRDLKIVEFGVHAQASLISNGYYDSLLRAELQISF